MVRTLLALDLGPTTSVLARAAAQLSAQSDSEIVIAHALAPLTGRDYPRAESECLAAAEQVQAAGGLVSATLIIRVSPPEDLILTSARELQANSIVMGWGQGEVLGSTLRGVLRAAPCSLFLVGRDCPPLDLQAGAGFSRLSIQDLPPLARLAALTRQLSLELPETALLAELDPIHSSAVLSRGVAS